MQLPKNVNPPEGSTLKSFKMKRKEIIAAKISTKRNARLLEKSDANPS